MAEATDPVQAAMVVLRLLVVLQQRQKLATLPNLAAWLGARLETQLEQWHNRSMRARLTEALAIQVKAGSLAGLLDLLDDEVAQRHDSDGAAEAARLVARIDSELAELAAGGPARAASARNVGHELVLGVGMTALTLSLIGTLVM
jgi:hypothetical protein